MNPLEIALSKLDCNDPGGLQIFNTEEIKHNGRDYHTYTFDSFMGMYKDPRTLRRHHECIHPNRPIRLFMDCDLKQDVQPGFREQYVEAVHLRVVDRIKELGLGIDLVSPRVLAAERPGKFSVHLIWDAWFPNSAHCIAFVGPISNLTLMGVEIDMFYPKYDSVKWMRMPYAYKKKGSGWDGLLHPPGKPEFDISVLCNSLVTMHNAVRSSYPLPSCEPMIYMKEALISKNIRSMVDSGDHTDVNLVIKWLSFAYPSMNPLYVKASQDGTWSFRSSMYCMVARRWHSRNHQYVHGEADGTILVRCTDPGCPGGSWTLAESWHEILSIDCPLTDIEL